MTLKPIDEELLLALARSGAGSTGRFLGEKTILEVHRSIDSTNSRALELIAEGAPEGSLVVSRQQTSGRGRLGRQWISPLDSGLYFSMIFKPERNPQDISAITLCTGVAVARALFATYGIQVGLKWVNDLVHESKKLGGILAEVPPCRDAFPGVVIGIGINAALTGIALPPELESRVTCLTEAMNMERMSSSADYRDSFSSLIEQTVDPAGNSQQRDNPPDAILDLNALLIELLAQIDDIYERLLADNISQILDEWRALSVTLGREVQIISTAETFSGIALDINNKGALIVETADRGKITVTGGEVSVRNLDGSYC